MSFSARAGAHEQIITELLKELQRNEAFGRARVASVMEAAKQVYDPQARSRDETLNIIKKIWDDVQAEN